MDFRRVLIALLLLFSTLTQASENTGIAFVHGTNDHREDAYGGYWKTDFLNSVSQGLANPENYLVVHCDYSQYMWHEDAGDCTAEQLIRFIDEKQLDSITVYTHSNGGNVMRWILSNPAYNTNYWRLKDKVSQIIAMAPSSAGTPIADLVLHDGSIGSNISWLLGFEGNAIKQQRVGDMAIYNEELLLGTQGRPELPIPFKTVVGTDVIASPFSSAAYCNGYVLNTGLKITKLYLDKCADGFLSCSSQTAAGQVWFYDKEQLDNGYPLNHNQSRHSCFGMDKILISTLATEGAVK